MCLRGERSWERYGEKDVATVARWIANGTPALAPAKRAPTPAPAVKPKRVRKPKAATDS